MYIMTQAPEQGEEPCLTHGLSVANTYTKMTTGSRHVAVVVKNQTAVPIIIGKGVKVILVVAANRVPPVEVMSGTLEKMDEMQGIQQNKMSIEQRKEMLFQQLDLSRLAGWSSANCTCAHALLSEYCDIFSLEPRELGCTSLAKHDTQGLWWQTLQREILKEWEPTWRKCWKQVLFALAKHHGVTLSC